MRCGFSMAQIGEFAFIIASLGLSLKVTSNFLYPVVVAVSVTTTFLTPYMIKAAVPSYDFIERNLPKKWARRISHLGTAHQTSTAESNDWRTLIRKMVVNTLIYGILSAAIVLIMFSMTLPVCRHTFGHWPGNAVCGLTTVALISPFLRSMVMKNLHSDEFQRLWVESRLNRLPLIFLVLVKTIVAASIVFYICNYLTRFKSALMITIALVAIILMALSRSLKRRSIKL